MSVLLLHQLFLIRILNTLEPGFYRQAADALDCGTCRKGKDTCAEGNEVHVWGVIYLFHLEICTDLQSLLIERSNTINQAHYMR